MNSVLQQTANCQITICLTQGVHPTSPSSPTLPQPAENTPQIPPAKLPKISPLRRILFLK
jgi:hypothetical protein